MDALLTETIHECQNLFRTHLGIVIDEVFKRRSLRFEEYQFQGIKKVTLAEEALADILPTVNTYYLYAKDEKGKKLRDDINVAIKELYQDGTLEKLSEQYFGYTTTPAAEDFESTIN